MDCSPPGSSIHEIFQARVLEWGAIAFSDNHVSQSLIINLSLSLSLSLSLYIRVCVYVYTHTHIYIYIHPVVLYLLRALTNKYTHTLWTAQVCSDYRILSCARLRMLFS